MADPFVQAAGILRLIATAVTAGKQVYDVTNEVKSAPQHIRALARDLEGFNSTLVQLYTLFTDENSEPVMDFMRAKDSETLHNVIENCMIVFSEIDLLMEEYKSRTKEMDLSTWRRVMWTFKETQVLKLRETLLSHKMNLAIAIALVNAWVQPRENIFTANRRQICVALHTRLRSSN